MSHAQDQAEPARDFARLLQAPLVFYKLGWGPALAWMPLLIITTEGRTSGAPRHTLVEYRRHGSKYYTVSGWGQESAWHQDIERNPLVTIQHGGKIIGARAQRVEDPAEALRALYMFSRNSWIYETLFARMTSAQAADLNTLAEVVEEFTVLRMTPTDEAPTLPAIALFSPRIQQMATLFALVLALRTLLAATRALFRGDR